MTKLSQMDKAPQAQITQLKIKAMEEQAKKVQDKKKAKKKKAKKLGIFAKIACFFCGHAEGNTVQTRGKYKIYICDRCGSVFAVNKGKEIK